MSEPSKPEMGDKPIDNDDVVRFDLRRAAEFLGISPRRLNILRRRGEIPARRVGLLGWSFRKPDLTAYVAGATRPDPPATDSSVAPLSTKVTVEPRFVSPDVPVDKPGTTTDSPMVRMANAILVTAIEKGASELHIEPNESEVRLRLRIDGDLQPFMAIPRHVQASMIARYKVMGDMITHKRNIAQRGSIPIRFRDRVFQVRVSCVPSLHGESLMMTILETGRIPSLADLGMSDEAEEALARILRAPNGLLLFAGPPGSGRTTTAASCLQRLAAADRTIFSWEEVREYTVSGVTHSYPKQTKVAAASDAVRALLAQKPDVLFVGDLDDAALAQTAVDAALAGTLILATVPALDPFDAVRRLTTFGIDRGLATRALAGVCAQRLVRRLCPTCKVVDTRPAADVADLWPEQASEMNAIETFRGHGCDDCSGAGTRGRTGLFEILPFDAYLADRISRADSDTDLRSAAKAAGVVGFRAEAMRKLAAGETILDEVTQALHRVR